MGTDPRNGLTTQPTPIPTATPTITPSPTSTPIGGGESILNISATAPQAIAPESLPKTPILLDAKVTLKMRPSRKIRRGADLAFTISTGPEYAGYEVVVSGSASGKGTGFRLGTGLHVSLDPDALLPITATNLRAVLKASRTRSSALITISLPTKIRSKKRKLYFQAGLLNRGNIAAVSNTTTVSLTNEIERSVVKNSLRAKLNAALRTLRTIGSRGSPSLRRKTKANIVTLRKEMRLAKKRGSLIFKTLAAIK